MGHERIGFLPRSKQWQNIVHELEKYSGDSMDVAKIAENTLYCIRSSFNNIAYHFELREIAKYLRLTKIAAYEPTHENRKYDFSFSEGRGLQLGLAYVVPIMIGLKICDSRRYSDFINGKDYTPLQEVAYCLRENFFDGLLSITESFKENNEGKTVVSLDSKLKELYNALFVTNYDNGKYNVSVGEYSFGRSTKETLIRTTSLLSKYANTDID